MTTSTTPANVPAPLFDPHAFRLTQKEIELTSHARQLGHDVFAGRAHIWDRDASFPTANYQDLFEQGFLGVAIPEDQGGRGADYRAYMLTAAEFGRFCGATALTWNMHVCSCLWTGPLADDLKMEDTDRAIHDEHRRRHYARIVNDGHIYSQPFSEGGGAAAGVAPFQTRATPVDGGWKVNGKKIFASLSGHANSYGILCGEIIEGKDPTMRDTLYLGISADAKGVSVEGEWDPVGMRGTVSRTLIFNDVFVPHADALMPRGVYYQAASRWPHMFLTLSPTYMGIAQAAYDFTRFYLRGEVEGLPPVQRRQYPTKQIAVAEMTIKLEQAKALWFQAISEAGIDPSREQVIRAYAAQNTVMETANEMCRLAIRTCGGQSMLKSLPLERLYRDSRLGSLMLPWTAEICVDRIGKMALYEPGEQT